MPDILTKTQKYCGFADNFERCVRPIADGYWCPLHPFAPMVEFAENCSQTDLQVSEAVPEAKTGVQGDSGAGIGLPEPSATPETVTQLQQAVIEHDADMARLDRNTLSPPETIRISLPALRAILLGVFDDGDWDGSPWATDDPHTNNANEQRLRFADELERRLRQLPARG